MPPLSSFDGPFQVAEYLSTKVKSDPHDIKGLVDVPRGLSAQRGTDESQVVSWVAWVAWIKLTRDSSGSTSTCGEYGSV